MKINIETVAEKAGVSIATVSRVLKDFPGVKEKTKTKVLKAVKELNYEINAVARNLRENKTNIIGIIIGNVLSPFHSVIAKSVEDIANKNGYNLILCNSDDNPEKELKYLKVLKSNRVDGILLTSTCKNSDYINYLINSGTPIVLMNQLIDGVDCDAVIIDNENSAYNAVNYLISKGNRRIAIVVNSKRGITGKGRLQGYLRALNENGIAKDDNLISYYDPEKIHEMNINLSIELLEKHPDAVFATNLDSTLGLIFASKELGLKVPENIEIVGFDDSIWFSILEYKVTTVRQPVYDIGATAAELLIKKIRNEQRSNDNHPLIITLNTELVIRK